MTLTIKFCKNKLCFQLPSLFGYGLNSYFDWQHKSQVDSDAYQCFPNYQLPVNHGKVLGGSSCINYMMYVRGNPNDFDTWAAITNDQSWNYTNVLPYFKKSERLKDASILNSPYRDFHGTEGYLNITKLNKTGSKILLNALNESGFREIPDINGYNTIGVTEQMVTAADGIRQSTANAFLSSIKERTNLHVLKESHVKRIITDQSKVARDLEVIDKNN